jgi:60 kDa SS-A/Ro ribonucleoprotein
MYLKQYVDRTKTPQSEPLSREQVKNRAGGYVYKVDDMTQLNRFLILGSCGGTYYASERKMTTENLDNVRDVLDKNGAEVVRMATDISESGRAPKNDQAIMVLAMASVHKDLSVRKAAFDALPRVCRIGTHLYNFLEYRKLLEGGWGRGMRDAVGSWFNSRNPDNLAFQVAKYKSRDGWSARDAFRKSHPKASSSEHDAVYKWVVSGGDVLPDIAPAILGACNDAAKITGTSKEDVSKAIKLITDYRLPREVLPTQLLNMPEIWEAMLPHMGITALIRNLGKMTSIGLLKPNSNATIQVAKKLEDPGFVKKGRIHPLSVIGGKMVYDAGHGVKGSLRWSSVPAISGSLEDAFYNSFGSVEPIGKRVLIGIDVSGSMSWGGGVMNVPGMTPAVVASVMAMTTVRTEGAGCYVLGFDLRLIDLGITKNDSLQEVIRKGGFNGGLTDCSLPLRWAIEENIDVDVLAIFTDNETWAGNRHPSVVLKEYRKRKGIDTRFVAVGITATNYSIADDTDPHSMNVSGFDSATPQIISAFARGEV